MDSDGQQIDFQLISSGQSSHYHQQHSNYFQNHQIERYFNHHCENSDKQPTATGILSQHPYQSEIQPQKRAQTQFQNKSGLFKIKQGRTKKFVEISRKAKEKYIFCKKGNKRQTSLLNINFKTFLSSLLREYLIFTNVTQYEHEKINEFFNAKANFTSFQKIYGVQTQQTLNNCPESVKSCKFTVKTQHDRLRKFLLSRFQKGSFMGKILQNKKMSYDNKLSIIKFSMQIRKSCITPESFNNWKTSSLL